MGPSLLPPPPIVVSREAELSQRRNRRRQVFRPDFLRVGGVGRGLFAFCGAKVQKNNSAAQFSNSWASPVVNLAGCAGCCFLRLALDFYWYHIYLYAFLMLAHIFCRVSRILYPKEARKYSFCLVTGVSLCSAQFLTRSCCMKNLSQNFRLLSLSSFAILALPSLFLSRCNLFLLCS